ncbi:hypothetical protein C667_22529, partial [Thauera phenylacetica B4P]
MSEVRKDAELPHRRRASAAQVEKRLVSPAPQAPAPKDSQILPLAALAAPGLAGALLLGLLVPGAAGIAAAGCVG